MELKRYRDNLENRVKKRVGELYEEIQERRDIEDSYRALVEHARDGIAIIHDFKVRFANPAFIKLMSNLMFALYRTADHLPLWYLSVIYAKRKPGNIVYDIVSLGLTAEIQIGHSN